MKFDMETSDGRILKLQSPFLKTGQAAEVEIDGARRAAALLEADGANLVLILDGKRYPFRLESIEGNTVAILHRNRRHVLRVRSDLDKIRKSAGPQADRSQPQVLVSMLPGVIRQVYLQPGSRVEPGTPILTLEAMKMENEIRAEIAGRIESIQVKPGQVVAAREPLARILPE